MRLTAFLLFLVFIGFALAARWYFVCQLRQLCGQNDEAAVESYDATLSDDIRLRTLNLREDGRIILGGYDQFAFDSAGVAPRLNDNNRQFLDTLATLLRRDTTKRLTITGLYRDSEADIVPEGFFENLGVARADAVRKQLVLRGIAENRITLDHNINSDPRLREPLLFDLYVPTQGPEEFEKVAFTFTNMTFSDANFAFNSAEFKPGDAFTLYADSVKTYLELNPEKDLTIIGHTDDVGTNAYNQDLGLRRARNAKAYFEEKGVTATINVKSEGESRPVASNKTSEGRQKNRRVNFVLD